MHKNITLGCVAVHPNMQAHDGCKHKLRIRHQNKYGDPVSVELMEAGVHNGELANHTYGIHPSLYAQVLFHFLFASSASH